MARDGEFQRALRAGWEKAKQDKLKRRADNREKWARRRDWSSDDEHVSDARVEENVSETVDNAAASLTKMRRIMSNPALPLYRRLEAAEIVLSYELGPGAAAGTNPEQIAAGSYKFLRAVTDDETTPESLKFRALKALVGIENSRAAARSINATHEEKRRLLLNLINAERVQALRRAGTWNTVLNQQWALESSDQFDWPEGWPGLWQWPVNSFSNQLSKGSNVDAFRRELLSIRAKNRPDDWERFLAMAEGFSATEPQKS
jgi:hypothetical protein